MGAINERYKYSIKDFKKYKIWVLVLNVISLFVMVLAIFVPYNKMSMDKLLTNTFESAHKMLYDGNMKLSEFMKIKNEKIDKSLEFSCLVIFDYPVKSEGIKSEGADFVEYKDERLNIVYDAINDAYDLLSREGDYEKFKYELSKYAEKVSGYERKVSVFDLVKIIMPETSVANLIKKSSNIFGLDGFGNILVSIPFFIFFIAISAVTSIVHIISSIVCLVNPEAATRRCFKKCVGEDGKKQNSQIETRQQGQYFFPWYIFAYIIALLIALLPRSGKVFVKNISSCIPFVSLTFSPFAYVLIAIEAVVFILSLIVNSMKHGIRNRL